VIEEVSLTTDLIVIYVRNIGKTTVSINDVLIEDSNNNIRTFQKSSFATLIPGTTTSKDSIVQGELLAIRIDQPNLPDSGVYTVKVFTQRGVGESYQVVA